MGYYKDLNDNMKTILYMLDNNQELKRLLFYNDTNPFGKSNPDIQGSLIGEKIFPYPKREETEDLKTSYINVIPKDSSSLRNNQYYRDVDIIIEVVCHTEIWAIRQGYRPLLIMDEIDRVFSNPENIKSVGDINFKNSMPTKFNNKFYGYTIAFKLTNGSKKGCNSDG